MTKLLELKQKARKLTIAINKLQSLETRSTDQNTADDADGSDQ